MDARLQNRIQRYGWNQAADLYEDAWAAQLRPGQDAMLTLANLRQGERVMDIACGAASVTLRVADLVGPGGSVLGTDISDRMVDVATAAAQGRPNLAFRRLPADARDLDGAGFDAALCAVGLMYVPDPVEALAAMRAALRPGGRAAAAVWGRRACCGWADIFPIVDARVESEVCPLFFQLGAPDALALAFQTAGFTDVVTQRIETTLDYPTAEAALAAAFEAGPVALAWSRFDEKTRAEARAEYLASIEPYRTGDGYALPGEFVAAVGQNPA
jgi:ubiquinone/menaquinone biosynthesis C-methylase UbiE